MIAAEKGEKRRHWMHEGCFELTATAFERQFDSSFCQTDGEIIVLQIEGRVNNMHADDLAVRRVLSETKVVLTVGEVPMWRGSALMITPVDSLLEARVKALESMLAHLLELEAPDGSRERKLRDVMERLGWQPPKVVDNRQLITPIVIEQAQSYGIVVTRPTVVDCDVEWTCSLVGLQRVIYA